MESFEEAAQRLTAGGENSTLPGFTALIADDNGTIRYNKSFGTTPTGPLTADTPIWVASCTKFLVCISALQCVERGLLSLDEDISRVLPEFSEPDILLGFNEETGEPLFKKAKNEITLRHLLSHTSGLVFGILSPKIIRLREYQKQDVASLSGRVADWAYPLLFEPGESWEYSVGFDWAGKAIERVNGNIRLGDFMKKNIWEPLGMHHSTFQLSENDYVRENLGKLTIRDPTTRKLSPGEHIWPGDPLDDCGGIGLFTTSADYLKVLISILRNDGKLLSAESVDLLFEPQLKENVKDLHAVMSVAPFDAGFVLGIPTEGKKEWNWSLAGLVSLDEYPGYRSKGTLSMSGMSNPIWYIDRERKICGVTGIQLLPVFDTEALDVFAEFQKNALEEYGQSPAKN